MENLFCHTMQNMNTKLDPLLTTQVCSRRRFDPRSLNPVFCFFFQIHVPFTTNIYYCDDFKIIDRSV